MVFLLGVGIPALVILGLVTIIKLNSIFSYVLIILLGILSTYVLNYTYCNILGFECKPDSLNALGEIIHSGLVIVISSIIYALLPKKYKKRSVDVGG